jgi:hypothetical protein
MNHELKTWPRFFEPLVAGKKTFELRENDRKFKEGDTLTLKEFIPDLGIDDAGKPTGTYSGSEAHATVLGVTDLDGAFMTKEGWVILSIRLDGSHIVEPAQEIEGAAV